MTTIQGQLIDGKVQLLEPVPSENRNSKVIISIIEDNNSNDELLKMNENIFWSIFEKIDWSKKESKLKILPCINELSQFSKKDILEFEHLLSEKLYSLDGQKFASKIVELHKEDDYFPQDSFLYLRCFIIANGKEYYEHILNNPDEIDIEQSFESILYIAERAYKIKTGQDMYIIPRKNKETFSNQKNW